MDIQANLGGIWTCDLGEIRMTPHLLSTCTP